MYCAIILWDRIEVFGPFYCHNSRVYLLLFGNGFETMDFFPWQPQSAQCLQGPDAPSVCLCLTLRTKCFQCVGFFQVTYERATTSAQNLEAFSEIVMNRRYSAIKLEFSLSSLAKQTYQSKIPFFSITCAKELFQSILPQCVILLKSSCRWLR